MKRTSFVESIVTRRGTIRRFLRERYLRSDISCHSLLCERDECRHAHSLLTDDGADAATTVLYTVVDASFLCHYVELLEAASDFACDLIIPKTVLYRFKRDATSAAYNRFRSLHNDPMRRVVIFDNEHCDGCYYTRPPTQSVEEYECTLVLRVAEWYQAHLAGNHRVRIAVVSLSPIPSSSSSLSSSSSSSSSSITWLDAESYMNSHRAHVTNELRELYAAITDTITATATTTAATATATTSSSSMHPRHLSAEECEEGLRTQQLWRGYLRVNEYRVSEVTVDLGGGRAINNHHHQITITNSNRAVHGDEVVVRLSKTTATEAVGEVVGILTRNWRSYVATIEDGGGSGSNTAGGWVLCVPMDRRVPKIRIRARSIETLANSRILVNMTEWRVDSRYPDGHYVRMIGPIGDIDAEMSAILLENDIHPATFPPASLRELPHDRTSVSETMARQFAVGYRHDDDDDDDDAPLATTCNPFVWQVPAEAMLGRVDLRASHRGSVCSIDPNGCTDIDDALSVLMLPNGNVQLGVHIADVSYFVRHNSRLDMDARSTGTTVYLVDRRMNMLPSVLSEDLCSLRGGTDRLCVSVLWEVEWDECKPNAQQWGRVVNTWIGRTVVHNDFALSYTEAQALADATATTQPLKKLPPRVRKQLGDSIFLARGETPQAPSAKTLSDLCALAPKLRVLLLAGRCLRAGRLQSGAVELHSIETHFKLDQHTRTPVAVEPDDDVEMHHTIAEFMIHANRSVAERIFSAFPSCALLRHHLPPQAHQLVELERLIERMKIQHATTTATGGGDDGDWRVQTGTGAQLAATLRHVADTWGDVDEWIVIMIRNVAARCMSEAHYISTGTDFQSTTVTTTTSSSLAHYGLGVPLYTHFTSPIRRYADLVVHRQLLLALMLSSDTPLPPGLTEPPFSHQTLYEVAERLNVKNRAAKMAARQSNDLFMSAYVKRLCGRDRAAVRFDNALIYEIVDHGRMKVFIPQLQLKTVVMVTQQPQQQQKNADAGVDCVLMMSALEELEASKCTCVYDEQMSTLSVEFPSGSLKRHTFCLFDRITVDVLRVEDEQHRYRVVKPTATVAWSELMSATMKHNRQQKKKVTTAKNEKNEVGLMDVGGGGGGQKEEPPPPPRKRMSLYGLFQRVGLSSADGDDGGNHHQQQQRNASTTKRRVQMGGRIAFL